MQATMAVSPGSLFLKTRRCILKEQGIVNERVFYEEFFFLFILNQFAAMKLSVPLVSINTEFNQFCFFSSIPPFGVSVISN